MELPKPVSSQETGESSSVLEEGGEDKFKTSEDIAFYRRQVQQISDSSPYQILMNTLTLSETCANVHLHHSATKEDLLLELHCLKNGIVRVKINELQPIKPRYEATDALIGEQHPQRWTSQTNKDAITLSSEDGHVQLQMMTSPFHMELSSGNESIVSVNAKGRLHFETLQAKLSPRTTDASNGQKEDPLGLWKEEFKTFTDIKANGPSSVGLDFTLHHFEHVYGIPEHADALKLQNTRDGDPYRLYNLDVFAYKIWSKMGLYGSVPLLIAHKPGQTVGIFWLNASETLVDINIANASQSSDVGPPEKRRKVVANTDVVWMSESGVIDAFILLGPSPFDVFRQYAELTGFQALPPLFALGYHQCRWNYENQEDVLSVDQGFDKHGIPYDVIWLDIEHTQGKRYFTWDEKQFPDPQGMQLHLQDKKRKLVVISDPHIKIDPDYFIFSEAKKAGYFVKDSEGNDFVGSCWPGPCSYLDFCNPEVRKWYSDKFSLSSYKGSTDSLFIWNDMNEPSVFDGPEQTMSKNAVHFGGWEHRDLHNLYGFYQHWASADGLIQRSKGSKRPFVLSRSFFAGSQRFGAVWTGDNVASWEYLQISIPMLLALSITGISFCGADIGGFVQDPEPELLIRWYQAGALQPFFRGHSSIQTKRREPWLFGEKTTQIIKKAIQERYCLLPYWYTLFCRAHTKAEPVIRPVWVEFPKELNTFALDSEYMIGNALLAHPVTEAGAKTVNILLPGSKEKWYDVRTCQRFEGDQTICVSVNLESVPVFQRGGTVIPRKTEAGMTTASQTQTTFSLSIALDSKGFAEGELYIDDGYSFSYKTEKQYCHWRFVFLNNVLKARPVDKMGKMISCLTVERVWIMGLMDKPVSVTVPCPGKKEEKLDFSFKDETMTIGNLQIQVLQGWLLKIK
ncbi:neutral alpha-glucosidase C isoform X1 [Polypterus senegalus]|uniref:neutral alpha-glucosidase C isoform X1 n=2 Tax=Polypterus senegalus TaxID=55291 RepID=UPI001964AC68|nr:neutral alpha-glucosidase C isoform X1 [Polypterus senegalus]